MKYQKPNAVRKMMAALCVLGILFLLKPAALTVNAEGEAVLTALAVMEEGKSTETVTVTMEGNPGIWGLKFNVLYDHNALALQSVEKGSVFAESDAAWSDSLEREPFVFAAAASRLEDITADGTMVTLSFAVKGSAPAEPSPVTLEIVQAINAAGEDVDITSASDTAGSITIKPADVIEIRGLKESYPYTGARIIPDFDVVDIVNGGPKILSPGIDYAVKYANNVKPGKAVITIMGRGNYTGANVTAEFTIKEAETDFTEDELLDLKGAKLDKLDTVTYTGAFQYPEKLNLRLKGEKTYTEYVYKDGKYTNAQKGQLKAKVAFSNNRSKGTASILLTGKKDSKGSASSLRGTFKILPVNLRNDAIIYSNKECTNKSITAEYAVTGAVPKNLYVKAYGVAYILENGRDYSVKCSNNTSASGKKGATEGRFIITGKGNFTGSYIGSFAIDKLDLSKCGVKALAVYEGMKASDISTKAATIADTTGNALKASQYKLNIKVNGETPVKNYRLKAGDKITVSALAKDAYNLTGQTAEAEFTAGKNIYKVKVEMLTPKTGKPYTGKPVKLAGEKDFRLYVMVKNPTTKKYEKQYLTTEDYEVVEGAYVNNINRGTAKAVIKGKGVYSGTKTINFKIAAKTMKNR